MQERGHSHIQSLGSKPYDRGALLRLKDRAGGIGVNDAEEARRNSPLLNLPARTAKLIVAYGADELPELKRQSREFAAAWSGRGLPGEIIEVAGCHHYAVLEQLAQPDGLLAKALARRGGRLGPSSCGGELRQAG